MTEGLGAAQTIASRQYELVRLAGRTDASDFAQFLRRAKQDGVAEVVVDARNASHVYPNGATPVAALIQHFRQGGMSVPVLDEPGSYFSHARVRNPLHATPENLNLPGTRLNVVWAYEREHAMALADCIVEELSRRIVFAPGTLPAVNWCLFEVLDNVFEHSNSTTGYFMAQIHHQSQQLTVCIADTGVGIHRSFYLGGVYRPQTAFDALTLSVREGVSSTGDRRGNGLFGLKGMVEMNGGQLFIASGRAFLRIRPSGMDGQNLGSGLRLDEDHDCAVVDFQVNVGSPVDIGSVLGGGRHIDTRLEAIESEDGGHVLLIREHSYGTGSRQAARELRNHIENYLHSGAALLTLDFENVLMVSSSFADETIGKLAADLGPVTFGQRFRLINMSADVRSLLDRAIAIRLSATYQPDDSIPRGRPARRS